MAELAAVLRQWEMAPAPAGLIDDPSTLAQSELQWTAAVVPGTAAGALRDAGSWSADEGVDFDEFDWWFRTEFDAPKTGAACLRFGGIATIAEVWLNGRSVLKSDNMFLEHVVEAPLGEHNEMIVCCRSLRRHLSTRRLRPRWKTRLVESQQLRWVRTTLLGRMPSWTPPAAPVGLWRAVDVLTDEREVVRVSEMSTGYESGTGSIDFAATVDGIDTPRSARLVVGDVVAELVVGDGDGGWSCSGRLIAAGAAPWFPSTAGEPALHRATLQLDVNGRAREFPLGNVGYRTITVDESDDGFALRVNDVPVFCRGACWVPPDVISLNASRAEVRSTLERVRAAGMNMVRIAGTMVYEHDDFYDLCDELGILVWQDFMFANMDYPVDDPEFLAGVEEEAAQLVARLRRHPSVVVVCGGSEVEQQAEMMGVTTETFANPLGRSVLADAVAEGLPGAAYVPCSPSGGVFSFSPASGVAHYYGVGAYLRPLEDARRASVRFASECLAFANIPARESVDAFLRDGDQPGHSPRWKARAPRDRGAGWDFDDVRDHYVRRFFGCDPAEVRYADPERYLDLGRAAVHIAIDATISEWRRPGSDCAGAVVLQLRDLWEGPGWGLLDHTGRPKSAYDAMARSCAPRAVLLTDEGLNGLVAHLVNDCAEPFNGSLSVRIFGVEGTLIAAAKQDVSIRARDAVVHSIDALMAGFRDLTYAYRFGPRVSDVVTVQLEDESGIVSEAHFLPGGHARPVVADLGLRASGRVVGDEVQVHVESEQFAQFVSVDIRGHVPDVNWFHLPPGDSRTIVVRPVAEASALVGEVTALNLVGSSSVKFVKENQP